MTKVSFVFLLYYIFTTCSTLSYIDINVSFHYKNNKITYDFSLTPSNTYSYSETEKLALSFITGIGTGITKTCLLECINRYTFTTEQKEKMITKIIQMAKNNESTLEHYLEKKVKHKQSHKNKDYN